MRKQPPKLAIRQLAKLKAYFDHIRFLRLVGIAVLSCVPNKLADNSKDFEAAYTDLFARNIYASSCY